MQLDKTFVGLYIVLQVIAIYIEFGTLFFVISLFYVIYTNTEQPSSAPTPIRSVDLVKKSRKKQASHAKKQEIINKIDQPRSAYSVFNKGVQRIEGSLTAEQFESELYGKKQH